MTTYQKKTDYQELNVPVYIFPTHELQPEIIENLKTQLASLPRSELFFSILEQHQVMAARIAKENCSHVKGRHLLEWGFVITFKSSSIGVWIQVLEIYQNHLESSNADLICGVVRMLCYQYAKLWDMVLSYYIISSTRYSSIEHFLIS